MTSTRNIFVAGPNGALHLSVYEPVDRAVSSRWVVHVPAFGEEMNKGRPMVSRQARRMSDLGYVVVVPDLSGTGDSQGHFSNATWDSWREDLKFIMCWARTEGAQQLVFWA